MKAVGIDHVVLRVGDLQRSVEFYRAVLGLTVDRRRDDLGLVHMRAGRSLVDLVAVDGPLGTPGGGAAASMKRNMEHLCLSIAAAEIGDVVSELIAAGVAVGETGVRYGGDGSGASVYLEDPDGNKLELRVVSESGLPADWPAPPIS